MVDALGFSPVVDWSPGIGSDRELFTLPCFIDDMTRAFLYAPEFVRNDRTGGPDVIQKYIFWHNSIYSDNIYELITFPKN